MKPEKIKLAAVESRPKGPVLSDPASEVVRAVEELKPSSFMGKGESVAVAVGSRGIDGLAEVVKTLVELLKNLGTLPFIVPAMGSHGGGKARGQAALLEELGVTEESVGAPVRSSTKTVPAAETGTGIPLHMDKLASEADGIAVVNRVKPHTRFAGPIQSGLCKMTLVGLGNPEGAACIHTISPPRPFEELAREAVPLLAKKTPLSFGLALVENGKKRLGALGAALPPGFPDMDAALLRSAEEWMPRLPFDEIDLLIVDAMGKEISGTGMDTNVIGRKEGALAPRIARILVRDLTAASKGNATGIGFAHAVLERCASKVDRTATALNCNTAARPEAAMVPAVFGTDREAIENILASLGRNTPGEIRIVRIADTASLERIEASEALLAELDGRTGIRIFGPAERISFDSRGFLKNLGARRS